MIDYLTFIEELSVVEKLLENEESGDPVFNIIIAKGKIRDLKRKYEKRVSDFESEAEPSGLNPETRVSSCMENYQNSNMRDYDDTQKYDYNSEGDIVKVSNQIA